MPKLENFENTNSVLLAGLGLSGLITACLLVKYDFSVQCFEPRSINKKKSGIDKRTTAFLNSAIEVFKEIGVWEQLEKFSQPLSTMEIIDVSDNQNSSHISTTFKAKEISLSQFGFNIPNDKITGVLLNYLEKRKKIKLNFEDQIISHFGYDDFVLAKTRKGNQVRGKLLIACDGKDSIIREKEKIKSFRASYNQLGLVFQVTHNLNHNDVTTEILDKGGPFTIIPLKKNKGCNHSTIVWMDYSKNIREISNLNEKEFNNLLQEKSLNTRGKIKLSGGKQVWPIMTQISRKLYGKRVAIVAESAHVMPPTGAQGLNTSIEDIKALFKLLLNTRDQNKDIGSTELLKRYNKDRLKSVGVKIAVMHFLNKISMTQNTRSQKLRKIALNVISNNLTLKSFLMNLGLNNKSL